MTMASSMTVAGFFSEGSKSGTNGTGNIGTAASGGIAVTARQCGLGVLDDLRVDSAGGYVFQYNKSTGKILAFQQTDPADAGGAAIPLVQVTSGDLSAAIFNWRALGS